MVGLWWPSSNLQWSTQPISISLKVKQSAVVNTADQHQSESCKSRVVAGSVPAVCSSRHH